MLWLRQCKSPSTTPEQARGRAPRLEQARVPGAVAIWPIISMWYIRDPDTKLIRGGGVQKSFFRDTNLSTRSMICLEPEIVARLVIVVILKASSYPWFKLASDDFTNTGKKDYDCQKLMIIIFLYIVELFVIKIVKNVIQNYIGIFIENDFWHPPPSYQFCTWILYVRHGYDWPCGRSARPPRLSWPQRSAQKVS